MATTESVMSGKHHQHNEQYTVSDFLHPTVSDCVRISAKGFSSENKTRMTDIQMVSKLSKTLIL